MNNEPKAKTPTLKIGDTLTAELAKQLRVGDRVLNYYNDHILIVEQVGADVIGVRSERDSELSFWSISNLFGWDRLTLVSRGPDYDACSGDTRPREAKDGVAEGQTHYSVGEVRHIKHKDASCEWNFFAQCVWSGDECLEFIVGHDLRASCVARTGQVVQALQENESLRQKLKAAEAENEKLRFEVLKSQSNAVDDAKLHAAEDRVKELEKENARLHSCGERDLKEITRLKNVNDDLQRENQLANRALEWVKENANECSIMWRESVDKNDYAEAELRAIRDETEKEKK